MRFVGLMACGAVCIVGCGTAGGAVDVLAPVPDGALVARLELVAGGLSGVVGETEQYFPTDVAALPDGRLLVMTLGGVVRVAGADGELLATPYLDVSNERTLVTSTNFGMTSIAVHPGFGDPSSGGYGKLYIVETEEVGEIPPDFDGSLAQTAFGGRHHDVLVEYTAAEPSSGVFSGARREVLRVEQPGWDHNVFDLAFGIGDESGMLYIASGDGANASAGVTVLRQNAQSMGNVFGKILRIDPLGADGVNGRYGVPASNPFVGVVGVLPEIYSSGHRAPWRMSVDRVTGEKWVGEVGQRNVEEFNRLAIGGNFGWAEKEGSFLFNQLIFDDLVVDTDGDGDGTGDFAEASGYIDPVFEYDHGSGIAAIGGSVYRGERWPLLEGMYVCGDLVRGGILQTGFYYGDASSGPVSGETGGLAAFRVDASGESLPGSLFGFGEGAEGELYLVGSSGGEGVLLRMVNGCPADLALPAGVLDLADITAFVGAFGGLDASADLAEPRGVFDLADLSAFVGGFVGGCD